MRGCLLLLAAATLAAQSTADRLKELTEPLYVQSEADAARVTKPFVERRLAEVISIVQAQTLRALAENDDPASVRARLAATLKPIAKWESTADPQAMGSTLRGVKTVMVAYSLTYGPIGIPDGKVVIEAYRNAGTGYRLAARTGNYFDPAAPGHGGCGLTIQPLPSPRPPEAWFLARCKLYGASRRMEKLRVFSFNGARFGALWTAPDLREVEDVQVSGDRLIIHHRVERTPMADTIELKASGITVSTAPAAK